MPVTHNKGPLPPDHPFAKGLIVSGQKRPGSSKNSSDAPEQPSASQADPMQAGIDANEESLRRMFAERKAKRGTGESPSPELSPSEASTTPTPPDSEA